MANNQIRCPSCNKMIPNRSRFCPFCNSKVTPQDGDGNAKEEKPKKTGLQNAKLFSSSFKPTGGNSSEEKKSRAQEEKAETKPEEEFEEPVEETKTEPEEEYDFSKEEVPSYGDSGSYEDDFGDEEPEDIPEEDVEPEPVRGSVNSKRTKPQNKETSEESKPADDKKKKNFLDNALDKTESVITGFTRKKEESEKYQEERKYKQQFETLEQEEQFRKQVEAAKRLPKYEPNKDGYYNNVIAEIDERIDHLEKDTIVKAILFVTVVFALIITMINIL